MTQDNKPGSGSGQDSGSHNRFIMCKSCYNTIDTLTEVYLTPIVESGVRIQAQTQESGSNQNNETEVEKIQNKYDLMIAQSQNQQNQNLDSKNEITKREKEAKIRLIPESKKGFMTAFYHESCALNMAQTLGLKIEEIFVIVKDSAAQSEYSNRHNIDYLKQLIGSKILGLEEHKKNDIAPRGCVWLCLECSKQHRYYSRLRFMCNTPKHEETGMYILAWEYSLKFDSNNRIADFMLYNLKDN